ncbi:hypothetical protein CRE_06451 [Caenorhabditis remanei]|uniref:Uncharacterized protein n=1 Tax=Caenorhabditis remanei TaxID=31234 RepID=E3M117_CAERE|nr:hypothetical protein CRE_06451 [Caenorhabditis remanei]
MIFLANSTYHLWVPIYIFNGGEYKSPFMVTLIIFEFLISVFCVLYTLKLCELIWKIRVFHVNMSILAVAYLIQYIECFVGKWLMMGHQTGLIGVEGVPSNRTYMNWWTSDQFSIPRVQNPSELLPLLIGGCLIWHYLFSMIGFIFSFCAERAIATLLSEDYEKHQRRYISSAILIISHVVTIYLSYQTFTEKVEFVPTVMGCMICVSTSCVTFVIIMFVNLKINKLQSSSGGLIFYTLAFRFQVKENIRALKLAYRVLVCIGVYIFVLCIVLFTLFFDVFPSFNQFLIFLLENCIYLNPLVICSVVFYSIEPWQKALIRECPIFKSRAFVCIFSSSKHGAVSSKSSFGYQQTTDLYFTQLQTSWLKK